ASLSMGDIGSHCENLIGYLTDLKISAVSSHLSSMVRGRVLDDDAMTFLKFENGANGILWASQVLTGELNNLRVRIYGDKGGLRWAQMNPERLEILNKDGSIHTLTRGIGGLSNLVSRTSYLPSGHPEGLIEA